MALRTILTFTGMCNISDANNQRQSFHGAMEKCIHELHRIRQQNLSTAVNMVGEEALVGYNPHSLPDKVSHANWISSFTGKTPKKRECLDDLTNNHPNNLTPAERMIQIRNHNCPGVPSNRVTTEVW